MGWFRISKMYVQDTEPPIDQVCQVWLQWLQLLNFQLSRCHLAPYPSNLFKLAKEPPIMCPTVHPFYQQGDNMFSICLSVHPSQTEILYHSYHPPSSCYV